LLIIGYDIAVSAPLLFHTRGVLPGYRVPGVGGKGDGVNVAVAGSREGVNVSVEGTAGVATDSAEQPAIRTSNRINAMECFMRSPCWRILNIL
jgi:hypothetical protein